MTTFTSNAALSVPLHMSTEYQSDASAAWATTPATVNSSPGTGTVQSAESIGSSSCRQRSADATTSSPVTAVRSPVTAGHPTDASSAIWTKGPFFHGHKGHKALVRPVRAQQT